jgi:hypothetical protein
MASAKKQGAPEFVDDMGEIKPVGRKGGSKSGDKKAQHKKNKKK